jgi:hypothetical protein
MTESEVATVLERKWATKQLENVLKREAFVNTLKSSLTKMTTDIKVGTRFISTLDYDGNLYECKQQEFIDYMKLPVIRPKDDERGPKVVYESKRTELKQVDITPYLFGDVIYRHGSWWGMKSESVSELIRSIGNKTITLSGRCIRDAVIMAKFDIKEKRYWESGCQDGIEAPETVDFHIVSITSSDMYHDDGGQRLAPEKYRTCYIANGYFPELERATKRIWVRKCNLVAEALGKNIDSSKKSINFTLEKMSVRRMLQQECDKLEKVRKVFNKNNPNKSRSAQLKDLKEEQERLEPTLKRLELLFFDLYGKDISVDAYHCKKYGYLIPIKADFIVDLSGNTIEQTLVQKNDEVREQIDEQVKLRNQVVDEVIPAALHPERVAKEIEKHDIDGVFGDDTVVVQYYTKEGLLVSGVVNKSVLG